MRWGRRLWCVCSRSQGQPSGARSRAMMARSSSCLAFSSSLSMVGLARGLKIGSLVLFRPLTASPVEPTTPPTQARGGAGRLRPGRLVVGAFRFLAAFLFVLAVPVAIVTTNVRFLADEQRVYRYAVDEFGAVQTTGVSRDELLRAAAEIRAYFASGQDVLSIRVNQGDREISLFNARETAHMKDVKDRFLALNRVQEFSLLYALGYVAAVVLWAREVSLRGLALRVAAGCLLMLVAIGAASAFAMSGFDSAWTEFHRVLFSNDFWRLNPATDHLIQMFPPDFWESIVFFAGLLTARDAEVDTSAD